MPEWVSARKVSATLGKWVISEERKRRMGGSAKGSSFENIWPLCEKEYPPAPCGKIVLIADKQLRLFFGQPTQEEFEI